MNFANEIKRSKRRRVIGWEANTTIEKVLGRPTILLAKVGAGAVT